MDRQTKRPYARPVLVEYGPVKDLTLTNFTNNMNDKGNSSISMT